MVAWTNSKPPSLARPRMSRMYPRSKRLALHIQDVGHRES